MNAFSLSWISYLIGCAVLLTIYFAVLWLRYFRHRKPVAQVRNNRFQRSDSPTHQTSLFPETADTTISKVEPATENNLSVIVTHFTQELNALVAQLGALKVSKTDLVVVLQQLITKYKVLKGSEYRDAIGHLIAMEAETHCSIKLSAEDQIKIWQ